MGINPDSLKERPPKQSRRLARIALALSFLALCMYLVTACFLYLGVLSTGFSDGNPSRALQPLVSIRYESGLAGNLAVLAVIAWNVLLLLFVFCVPVFKDVAWSKVAFFVTALCAAFCLGVVLFITTTFAAATFLYLTSAVLYRLAASGG